MEHINLFVCLKQFIMGTALVGAGSALATNQLEQTGTSTDHTVITGSRLKQNNLNPASPVAIYTRNDILRSGENNVADFIRSLPVNTLGSFRPQSGSTAQENAFVSLRGMGSSRSLILLDGHRMPKSTTTAAGSNLNLLPMGAVERIEILPAASSAVYGTDAIGGVVNVITRKDFQGVEIMLGGGKPSIPKHGGERESGSVLFGTSSNRSKLTVGVSWNDREIIFERDVPWTRRGTSVYGNSFTTITDGFDNFDFTSFIGACDFPDSAYYTLPNSSSPNGTRCAYDFSQVSAEDASTENKAFFAHASHQLNNRWILKANTLFSQSESFGRYAPVPDSSFWSTPLSSNSPNNPTNPDSPLYDPSLGLEPQTVNWWHRFDTLGNRDTTVQTQWLDLLLSVSGNIGKVETEFGIRHTDNRTTDVGRNLLLRSAAQALIEGGSYSLLNPYATPESVLNQLRFTAFRDAKYDQDEIFATAEFELFELNGSAVEVLVGAEFLSEKYFDLADPQSQADQVGGTAGSSAFADRDTQSIFIETHVPILKQLTINLAGRFDDYSDIGDDLAGKISLEYQPFEAWSIHADYSTNHQTPNLKIMNGFDSKSFTSIRAFWPGCLEFPNTCNLSILEIIQSNPFLKSEQSEEFNFVVNFNPKEWMALSIRYWDIEIDDRIRSFSAQQINDLQVNGLAVPPGLGCDRAPTGVVFQCITGYANEGTLDLSGLDLTAEFNFPLFDGTVSNRFVVNHLLDLDSNESNYNLIGSTGYPELRASLIN